MKKLIFFIMISINLFSCTKDCSDERTEIYEKYQYYIDNAEGNRDEQGRLRDEREMKLAKLDC